MSTWIPPGGFAGFAQSTPAMVQNARNVGAARAPGPRKRRKKKAAAAPRARKRSGKRTRGGRRKLVKGSAAAKRFMANLRKKRRT